MTSNVFDDTDFESFSETSSEDQDDIFSIYGGQAQSILSNLEDSIGKIDDFLSFERGYIHGDIVRAVEDPSGQMGKVVQVSMFVDLENVFGEVIRDVSSTKLLRLRSFSVGDYVVHGPWLGRVHKIVDCVSVIFDDGTKCDIMATDPEKLVSISPNLLDDTLYPYHPGQRVKVVVSSLSNSSGWLCGMSKKNQNEGTICFVEAGIVFVDWLASAFGDFSLSPPPPSCTPHPGDLTTLSCFPHANWQLGEWCILPVSERSVEANFACPGNLVKEKWKKEIGSKRRDLSSKLENMFAIVRKRLKVDVMWQDGTLSRSLDSYSLFPVCALNSHDFFPEQLVLERASSDDSDVAMNRRWGVVKFVDANEHTLKVEWKRMDEDSRNLNSKLGEEMVSAYELIEHPDFGFSLGDIVFLLEKHHTVGQPDDMTTGELAMPKAMYVDRGSEQNRCFRSSVGNVVGLKNGNVQVQWATGNITEVAPYKLVRVDRDDGSITTHFLHEEDISGANHELAEQEKQSFNYKEMDLLEMNHVGEDYPKYDGNSAFFGFPQTAIGLFSSFATKIFGSPGYSLMTQPIPHSPNTNEDDTGTISGPEGQKFSNCVEALQDALPALNVIKDASMKPKVGETSENKELTSHSGDFNFEEFKQFDIAGDCSDHHFVNDVGNGSTPFQVKKGWLKKVQHEWSILEQDLPETIYVRIYEERMDLIRAAIVGASGTPYQDGLFFFDIYLPPDYPSEPPMVHYHSGGLRLNPNLYESGRVCLSLLNTWNGMGSEVWNPESSTILQVLLSLQALVLNEKPYFNEAGYDKQIGRAEGEKNSVSYNENAFLVTCRSMLYLLRKPPKNFESLVEGHFKRRSLHILMACKAYMDSIPVGLFGQEINITAENCRGNSTGFKIMLAKLYPKLVEAFSAGGIDSDQFLQFE